MGTPIANQVAEQVEELELRLHQLEVIAQRAIRALGRRTDFGDPGQCATYAWLERDFENATGHTL